MVMDWNGVEELFAYNDFDVDNTINLDHPDLTERLKKTLYYAPHKNPAKDTLPFSVTKAAVESFRKAAPTPCGKLGLRYASRVSRDACLSPCAMILAMIYIERLVNKNPDYLQRIQSSDLFLITMMVASKYLYDEGCSDEVYNDEWAISGLVDTDYVNALESDFLRAIDWRIFSKKEEFFKKLSLVEARLSYIESYNRGWLTYTDLSCILKSRKVVSNLINIVRLLSKAMCVSLTLYCGIAITACSLVSLMRAPMTTHTFSVELENSTSLTVDAIEGSHSSRLLHPKLFTLEHDLADAIDHHPSVQAVSNPSMHLERSFVGRQQNHRQVNMEHFLSSDLNSFYNNTNYQDIHLFDNSINVKPKSIGRESIFVQPQSFYYYVNNCSSCNEAKRFVRTRSPCFKRFRFPLNVHKVSIDDSIKAADLKRPAMIPDPFNHDPTLFGSLLQFTQFPLNFHHHHCTLSSTKIF